MSIRSEQDTLKSSELDPERSALRRKGNADIFDSPKLLLAYFLNTQATKIPCCGKDAAFQQPDGIEGGRWRAIGILGAH